MEEAESVPAGTDSESNRGVPAQAFKQVGPNQEISGGKSENRGYKVGKM